MTSQVFAANPRKGTGIPSSPSTAAVGESIRVLRYHLRATTLTPDARAPARRAASQARFHLERESVPPRVAGIRIDDPGAQIPQSRRHFESLLPPQAALEKLLILRIC